jgi:tetratricopeptide (TPR) repeat protein
MDGLRIAGALEDYWRMRGQLSEGRLWLDSLLAVSPNGHSRARAATLFGEGRLTWGQGDLSRATELTESALEAYRGIGDDWGVARSLMEIGLHSIARREAKRAAKLADESLALSRAINDDYALGYALILKAIVSELAGDKLGAEELFKEALAVRRLVGHQFGIVNALRSLGHMALRETKFAEAEGYYRESISIAWNAKQMYVLPSGLEGFAAVAAVTGAPEQAARLFGTAGRIRELLAVPPAPWEKSIVEGSWHALEGIHAADHLARLKEQGRQMTIEQAIGEILS